MDKDDRKQIDIVVKYFYPITAGIETTVMDTFSLLARGGWRVIVHTSRDTYLEKNVLADRERVKGLELRRYRWGRFGFWPQIAWRETDALVLENFNVFPHFQIMVYSWFLKFIGKKKFALFLTPHGGFNPEWRIFHPAVALIKKFYHYTIGTLLINLTVDGVQAVSEWEKREMIKTGINAGKIAVIENGLEEEAFIDQAAVVGGEFKKRVAGYGRYLLQIGRVFMIKNYETTIRALAELPSDINYVITGPIHDNKYKEKLDALAGSLGLSERVIYTGVIKGAEKFYLIRHAEMMVHMALWESFCCVVQEGMSQGLVCVVADNTALPYLVKDRVNGYQVPAKDHGTLAAKIRFVLDNPGSKEINEIRQNNLAYAKNISWNRVAKRVEIFYQTCIKDKK